LIINDHKRRIHHYLAGFPGTSHDNRIWKATNLFKNPDFYFAVGQYLLDDCAFFCDQKQVLQLARWREKESRDVASSMP
jgi:hypothetical protein